MKEQPAPGEWPLRKWLALFGVILGVQVLAVFWLSPRKTAAPPPLPQNPGTVSLPQTAALRDGLLIPPADSVLPRLNGFSGDAWLRFTNPAYASPAYSEPARELPLSTDTLGGSLVEKLGRTGGKSPEGLPQWEHDVTPVTAVRFEVAPKSWLEVSGGLLRWASNSIPELRPQPSAELLRPSVVQVGVDGRGMVFSAALVSKSGSAAADTEALALARSARFFQDPLADPAEGGSSGENPAHWGRLIFHWLTVAPPPETNSVANPGLSNAP